MGIGGRVAPLVAEVVGLGERYGALDGGEIAPAALHEWAGAHLRRVKALSEISLRVLIGLK